MLHLGPGVQPLQRSRCVSLPQLYSVSGDACISLLLQWKTRKLLLFGLSPVPMPWGWLPVYGVGDDQ